MKSKSTNSRESGHISALGKEEEKKKKNSIKAIRQQRNGNSIPIQNEHKYERDNAMADFLVKQITAL